MTVGLRLGPESWDSDPGDSVTLWPKTSNLKILHALVSPLVKRIKTVPISQIVVKAAGNNAYKMFSIEPGI